VTVADFLKHIAFLALSGLLLLQPAGAEESQDDIASVRPLKEWIEQSRAAVAESDPSVALEVLKQALVEYPDNFTLRSELATAFLHAGNPDKAVPILEDLQIKNSSDPSIKNNLAWVYATESDPKIRNPEKAVVLAREALQILPLSRQVWNTLTAAYHAKGDYTFAAYAAERTLELAQADEAPSEEIEDLQKQLRANRQLAEAVAPSVTEALAKQNREQEEFWTKAGQYELKNEHPREALAAFGIARSYNPNSRGARFGEAGIYLFLKQYRKGLDMLEQLAREYPNEFAIKNNIAWVYATAEDVTIRDAKKAISFAQDALLLSPDSYNVWSTLAEAYFMAGNYERSLRAAETALRQAQLGKATPAQIQGYQRQLGRAQRAADAMSLVE